MSTALGTYFHDILYERQELKRIGKGKHKENENIRKKKT